MKNTQDRDIISERIVDGFVYDPKLLVNAVLEIAEYLVTRCKIQFFLLYLA